MSREQWHAEIAITDEQVKNCLRDQFPALTPITEIQCIGEGWDNKVFLVNEAIIFRFPRRHIAVALIERENRILKNLSSLFSVTIPNPVYIGKPTDHYPYPFQGYYRINGVSGCQAQLSEQDRSVSITTLATFLKQLHAIDETQALTMGAEQQVFDRTDIHKMVNTLKERLDKISERKVCRINPVVFQQEITTVLKIILLPQEKCLVHGDLYCRHLLFDQKQLIGIIDWGDVGINNRSEDLAVIWSFYPASCHPAFFNIYGEVDVASWQYARFLGLYSALTLILYGHDINDTLLVTEAINTIKRINAALLLD